MSESKSNPEKDETNVNSDDDDDEETPLLFHEMGLDDRILKSIAKLGWSVPTLIQERAIPLIMDGKDVIAKGRTGSGKTGAFAIPIIQQLLLAKKSAKEQSTRALILAPTRELSKQIQEEIVKLTDSCGRVIRCVDVSDSKSVESQKQLLTGDIPDIVVGVPSRVVAHIKSGNLSLATSLEMLVIDEADLILSFGYENDLKAILKHLPAKGYQAILTSATLCEDVSTLKRLVLHNPVTLKLEEPALPESSQLTQYQIRLEEEDKFVLVYALFKLKLIRGKTIIFVNSVDRCYKMKLYLEQFGIPVCVLNSELPAASRSHIVGQFNRGLYEVIVASDEKFLDEHQTDNDTTKSGKPKKVDKDKERSKRDKDKESGVARGIDFQFVSNIINFDFPHDTDSYVHRVGRTARGNNKGTALSLVSIKEGDRAAATEADLKERQGEDVFKPFQFKMEELDGFRYRARDAWRSVTKIAVREARLKEIRQEMLNSVKLQSHLADNPRDAQLLKHDKALHTVRHQAHLKNVPDYIVPKALKKVTGQGGSRPKRKFTGPTGSGQSAAKKKFERKQSDALQSLTASKR